MVDKNYCMSSYLAFRYIERQDADFYEEMHHEYIPKIDDDEKIIVASSEDIDNAINKVFEKFQDKKMGLLLSGGMDSGIIKLFEGLPKFLRG